MQIMTKVYCSNYDCPKLDANSENCTKKELKIHECGCEFYMQFKTEQRAKENNIKLKECPFCRGEAKIIFDFIGGYRVICNKCFIMSNNLPDIETAAEAWNKRLTEDENA